MRTSRDLSTPLLAEPRFRLHTGTLEDSQVIEEEASKADIVLNWASSDHVSIMTTIKRGMERGNKGVTRASLKV